MNPTPGAATIQKTKYDITVLCHKDGYQEATYLNHSGAAGATFGNILAGGGIGWAIDSASGADNKYDSPVNLTMVPGKDTYDYEKHNQSTAAAPASSDAKSSDAVALATDSNAWSKTRR